MASEEPLRLETWDGGLISYITISPPRWGGDTILMLHGLGENSRVWLHIARLAAGLGARIVLPDLRGHGGSRPGQGGVSLEAMAKDLEALVKREGQGRVHLMGFSLGGFVVLEAVDKDILEPGGGFESAILVGALHRPADPEGMRARARLARERGVEEAARAIAAAVYRGVNMNLAYQAALKLLQRIGPHVYASIVEELAGRDYTRAFQRLTAEAPTTVVVGSRDPLAAGLLEEARRILGPRGRIVVIEGAGHLVHLEAASRLIEAVKTHLGSALGGQGL
ncbi:putative hydrolase [Aeropyrum pernix K1]|uniref:Hydrolase n=1 Tax=Aeropyrum pernix (strain ATCC 700893 / DSM 11879 / JCM 9820 / NBRC 100138 / K1) TaxID=272557 RepID=Q9Y9C6_AERPE|nr:alpha/beta hydrolase [Aeropyrum pernix]BAA81374.2 putative hydrolase [Aeropyrum pernix K1]